MAAKNSKSNNISNSNEPIAVIGRACRFAGDAKSPSKLWDLLKEPRDVLTEIPETRFSVNGFYHPDGSYHGHGNVRHSYLLEEDPRAFDTQFFGIKAVEAHSMDPQQRFLLETVYEGLESAGLSMNRLRGSDTGVYAGLMCTDYEFQTFRTSTRFRPTMPLVSVGVSWPTGCLTFSTGADRQ
jgi:hybrid polyketide synthase/nonribosomal peptide synthetase ACE1